MADAATLSSIPSDSGMKKIRLTFWDGNQRPTITKSFSGRWLVGDEASGIRADDERPFDAGAEWSAALTEHGQLVVYLTHCNGGFAPSMVVYKNFDEMREDEALPINVVAETAASAGFEFEIELDI